MPQQINISTIRHASTDFNAQRRYAGSIDVPLSDAGVAEARVAAGRLSKARFDVAITSPLKRARETARILIGGRVPIEVNKLCVERTFGVMEGLTWDEIRKLHPPILLIQVGYDLHTVNPKDAEPFEDVWERAKKLRQFLFARRSGSEILVVSHGVFLQLFNGLLRGLNCIESLAFYSHTTFGEVLCNGGIFGLGLLSVFYLVPAFQLIGLARPGGGNVPPKLAIGLLGFWGVFTLFSFFAVLFDSREYIPFSAAICGYLQENRHSTKVSQSKRVAIESDGFTSK